jgi:hypothetical protein
MLELYLDMLWGTSMEPAKGIHQYVGFQPRESTNREELCTYPQVGVVFLIQNHYVHIRYVPGLCWRQQRE